MTVSALQLIGVMLLATPALHESTSRLDQPEQSPGELKGRVQVHGNRFPLMGAVVRVEGLEEVAETDADGQFSLPLPPGQHRVTVWAQGFVELVTTENISTGGEQEVIYRLKPAGQSTYETRISARQHRGQPARDRLRDKELREVAGTQGEPLRVVSLLPGVAGLASGLSYPVVRGSSPATTGYFIDGVRIPQLFHLVLGPSVVHPDFLDSVEFHPGLAPVKYGRLMGGVVQGSVAEAREGRLRATAYVDLINAGGYVEAPLGSNGPSVTVAGRFSLLPYLGARVIEELTRPSSGEPGNKPTSDFWDYQARVEQRIGSGRLRLLALGSSDLVGSTAGDPSGFSGALDTSFHRVDARYTQPAGVGVLEAGATWGTEQMGAAASEGEINLLGFELARQTWGARASWSAELSPAVWLRVGADLERQSSTMKLGGVLLTRGGSSPENAFHTPALATMAGGYIEATWKPGSLEFLAGIRFDNYHLVPGMDLPALAPRLGARWTASDALSFHATAGLVHQAPTILLPLPVSDTAGLREGLQHGAQTSIGTQLKLPVNLELSGDVYYTHLSRAVEYGLEYLVESRRRRSSTEDPGVPGRAYGLELMLRRAQVGQWFGWISYSLQRSERRQSFYRFDDAGRATVLANAFVPFAFDQTHVLNSTLGVDLGSGVKLGTTFHFNSGRPEGGELTSRAQRPSTGPGPSRWVPADLDDETRLPAHFRIDLRVSKEWTFDDFRLMVYADVMNATVSQETLGYLYTSSPAPGSSSLDRSPIAFPIVLPMVGLKGTY